jgi:exonuclease SbcD
MGQYRFVHCADLHLDSPFVSADATHAETLRGATFRAYERIIDLCVDEHVDALLVAGDVFDSADNSLGAQLRFRDGLNRLANNGIRAFVCHGNHDPLNGWRAQLEWPEHAHRFLATPVGVPLRPEDPRSPIVYGVSYPVRDVTQNLIPAFPPPEPGRPAIGLLHTNVGGNPGYANYAPCSIADLTGTGYDYWALGHVHTRQVLRAPAEGRPVIVYPGNAQGRHPNERGERGAYLVEMDEQGTVTKLEFRVVDDVRWEIFDRPINDLADEQGLLDALHGDLDAALEASGDRHLVYRVRLSGRGPLHTSLARSGVVEDLRSQLNERFRSRTPFAICDRLTNETAAAYDRDELARGGDFVADLLAQIDALRGDAARLEELAHEAKFEALYRHVRAGRYLRDEQPTGEGLLEVLGAAEESLLDGLVPGSDPH